MAAVLRNAMGHVRSTVMCETVLVFCVLVTLVQSMDVIPMTEDSFVFTQANYNASITEGAVGKSYVTPAMKMGIYVTDPTFSVRYKVINGDEDGMFKADERLIGDFCFLRLRLRTGSHLVINRELNDMYKLTIKARGDYGHNRKKFTSYTEVIVNVLDENDLSPIFFERSYEKRIPETTPLHASIVRVEASDADIGVNGEIYYSFAEKTDVFAIHPTNGIVYLTRPLSYSSEDVFELEVLAKDRGPAPWGYHRPSRANLRVEVVKVNFHSPKIQLQELPAVIEHGQLDSVYAILYVSDEDVGINGEISSIKIINGDPGGYFKLIKGDKEWEYNIEVARVLDREMDPNGFNLTIQAADKGSPKRITTEVIHVKLQDTNDQTPQFEQDDYSVSVDECVPASTPLLFVKATDTDYAKNAEIQYAIQSGNQFGWFAVNADTGLLYVKSALDAENKTSVELVVVAEDQANMGSRRVSHVNVNITIVDCNDNEPVFMNPQPVDVEINEGQPVGSEVLQIKAYDLDMGENGYLSYSIANPEGLPFDIDHFTGKIITKEVLDYEYMRRMYKLQVRASDWGTPFRRESEIVVTIRLNDINDNKPHFEKVDCKGYVSRDAPVGTSLVVIPAIDFEVTNIISYAISSGNEDNCFEIISSNGELRTNCPFERKRKNMYSLGVTATDGINTAEPTYVNLTLVNSRNKLLANGYSSITCQDTDVSKDLARLLSQATENNARHDIPHTSDVPFLKNVHSPRFPPSLPSSIIVTEGRPVGDTIISLKAMDGDQGYNGRLVYVIASGNVDDVFTMNTYSGDLVVLSEIDREKREQYTLNISVSDMGSPPKSTYKILEIHVDDVNDNSPVFEKTEYSVVIREDRPINSTILRVVATDADDGMNAQMVYSILTDVTQFSIDASTGEISVKRVLDREEQPEYVLHIQAVDQSPDKPLTSVVPVTITLTDINDNSPKFQLERYHVRAREDLPVGTVVVTIQADDPDDGKGGEVRYALLDGMGDKFEIDRITGTIRIAQELDFEAKQLYNITARAKDRGDHSLSTRCEIIIEVVDVNENLYPPSFADFVFQGRVKENEPVNTIVMQLIAVDNDAKKNPLATSKDYDITYSIRNGSGLGLFTVDSRVQSPLSVVASLNGTLGCHLPGDALCNEQFMDHVCAITSGDMSVVADHSLGLVVYSEEIRLCLNWIVLKLTQRSGVRRWVLPKTPRVLMPPSEVELASLVGLCGGLDSTGRFDMFVYLDIEARLRLLSLTAVKVQHAIFCPLAAHIALSVVVT
ncbi:hypothetical protein LSH36_242g04003 [Paralvinella palmiformis]|uniref:Cadherin domain-containing protein n=1 Tax=Paralvinella palmiformis TaxID=53620 RepID=A0AAD9JMT6_9ANNE|nr:hypothetical protein LSH36_242g04003 [Paralvinella palmiformis]